MCSCRPFSAFVRRLSSLLTLTDMQWLYGSFKKSPVFSLSGEKIRSCTERTWSSSSQLRSSGKEAITDAVWMSSLFCKIKTSLREGGKNQATLVIFRLTCAVYLIFPLSLWYFLCEIYTYRGDYCIS